MKFFPIVSLLFFQFAFVGAQTSLDQIDLRHGKYKVGFRHYTTFDSTRTYNRHNDFTNKSMPRPIPVSIWYPSNSEVNDLKPLKVLDYMRILAEEEEWEHLPDEQILDWFHYLRNTEENRKHMAEDAHAYFNLQPAKSKFPVVIYAPSYQASSAENFALCELLASNGYVIISSPSRGTENRKFEGGTAKDMETQARDIEFLIDEIAEYPNADMEKLATMGFSFGGLSNVLCQMRNQTIKAVVSLDGSIKYNYKTILASPFFNIDKVDVPFIHMAQKNIPQAVLKADNIPEELNYEFEFYDTLKFSQAYQLKFHDLTHSYFSTLGVLFEQRDKRQDRSDSKIMESYKLMCKYTLNFLNASLNNDEKAQGFMAKEPSENGINGGLISISRKRPQKKQVGFNDFNDLAAAQNYDGLKELYAELRLQNHELQLPERDLNTLGLQLMFNPKTTKQGINIFILATGIYSQSANLFDSLAEAYLFDGNNDKAIENFKKSLELYPQNNNAIRRLKELEK